MDLIKPLFNQTSHDVVYNLTVSNEPNTFIITADTYTVFNTAPWRIRLITRLKNHFIFISLTTEQLTKLFTQKTFQFRLRAAIKSTQGSNVCRLTFINISGDYINLMNLCPKELNIIHCNTLTSVYLYTACSLTHLTIIGCPLLKFKYPSRQQISNADGLSKVIIDHLRPKFTSEKYICDILHFITDIDVYNNIHPNKLRRIFGDCKILYIDFETTNGRIDSHNVGSVDVAINIDTQLRKIITHSGEWINDTNIRRLIISTINIQCLHNILHNICCEVIIVAYAPITYTMKRIVATVSNSISRKLAGIIIVHHCRHIIIFNVSGDAKFTYSAHNNTSSVFNNLLNLDALLKLNLHRS